MKKKDLIRKKNVILVRKGKKEIAGLVTSRDAIRVGVTKKVPLAQLKPEDVIPKIVDGMETDVFETGEIRALRTGRYRPMPGGVSGGHPNVTAGTINPFVFDGIKYIMSNAHVISDCNNGKLGDQTWQPGKADGGGPNDTIGHLLKYVPIHFLFDESNCPIAQCFTRLVNFPLKLLHCHTKIRTISFEMNKVDCAISRPLNDDDLLDEILEIGKPTGFAVARIDDVVKQSGRTSAVTYGVVEDLDGIAQVGYGDSQLAIFEDQIITSPLAQPGDSGSFVLNEENKIIGILFAGSDSLTLVNKIQNVIVELGFSKLVEWV